MFSTDGLYFHDFQWGTQPSVCHLSEIKDKVAYDKSNDSSQTDTFNEKGLQLNQTRNDCSWNDDGSDGKGSRSGVTS